jgi:hypothetical protein
MDITKEQLERALGNAAQYGCVVADELWEELRQQNRCQGHRMFRCVLQKRHDGECEFFTPDRGNTISREAYGLILEDLGELLEVCGLGDYARPESPHEVMQQVIAEVRRLRDAAMRAVRLA